jgi:hypothetical protein
MSTSPIVTDQLHKHNTAVPEAPPTGIDAKLSTPAPAPKVWVSVDLPSLNLSDPVGTTVTLPLMPSNPVANPLKNPDHVSTPETSPHLHHTPMDIGLDARMAELRATSAALRQAALAVRRTTGNLK